MESTSDGFFRENPGHPCRPSPRNENIRNHASMEELLHAHVCNLHNPMYGRSTYMDESFGMGSTDPKHAMFMAGSLHPTHDPAPQCVSMCKAFHTCNSYTCMQHMGCNTLHIGVLDPASIPVGCHTPASIPHM